MSVNSRSFLDEAVRLLPLVQDEAGHRTVTSRAYYGAYHLANAWHLGLPSPGIPKSNCGAHKSLVHQLEHPTMPAGDDLTIASKSLGFQLKGMLLRRRKADYDLSSEMTARESAQAVAKSQVLHEDFAI